MDKLDKPLDSIIKENKKSGAGGAGKKKGFAAGVTKKVGRGGTGGAGGASRGDRGRGPARVGGGGIRKPQKLNQGAISNVGAILNTPGRDRGGPSRSFQKQAPSGGNSNGDWSHDMFEKQARQQGGGGNRRPGAGAGAGAGAGIVKKQFTTGGGARAGGAQRSFTTSGNKGYNMQITNLHYELNEKQLESIFSKEGVLKKVTIHYDRSGRSLGTADVIFASREEAQACARKYNNAKIEGLAISTSVVD